MEVTFLSLQILGKLVIPIVQTYRAILEDLPNCVVRSPPTLPDRTEILVTIVAHLPESPVVSRGAAMSANLAALADLNTFRDINPVEWQREVRQDAPLLGRES